MYLGRKRKASDLMTLANPQSMKRDYMDVHEGGYFLTTVRCRRHLSYLRTDITHIGIPLMAPLQRRSLPDATTAANYPPNTVYIGAP